MKALGISFSSKPVLLPVVMTVSLFLVFLGMRTPDLPNIQKPKGYNRAVVENQIKAAKTGIEKSGQTLVLGRRTDLAVPPSFRVSPTRPVKLSSNSTLVFPIPSRAPPAISA